ncbi:MAG: YCF48-related protein [Ignavibacteria bacterium]|nr:YCF48-related protein [Ignavibacteria bacterium]
MRRHGLLFNLLLVTLFSSFGYAQMYQDWKWVQPRPQGNQLRYIKRFDANTWYAVGFAGTFMKTTDGANSGTVQHNVGKKNAAGQYSNLYDAHFFDKQNGIVCGTLGTIAKTTNGGSTFDTIPNLGTTITYYQLFFPSNTVGFAVGSSGTIMKTTDAGATWNSVSSGVTTAFYDIWTSSDAQLIVIATTSGNVRRSTDGGATWASVATGTSVTLNKVHFIDNLTGFVVGTGQCRVTTDGGATWAAATTGLSTSSTYWDIDNIGSKVYLTGSSTAIYRSTNNGTSWDTVGFLAPYQQQPWTSTYYASDFGSTDDTVVTVGSFGLLNQRTSINDHFIYTQLFRPGQINELWTNSTGSKIIGVGAPSITGSSFDQFFLSTDYGQSWQYPQVAKNGILRNTPVEVEEKVESDDSRIANPKSVTSTATINHLQMIDENLGFAVGTNSAVYKTTNGGLRWDSIATTITAAQSLSKVCFVNANTGWVFSKTTTATGTIWKTTDGGATWAQQILTGQTGSNVQIWSAHMLNENYGWVCNYFPQPFKTTDGGATWTAQSTVDGYNAGYLYDIQMFDTTKGYIVGGTGRIYKTTNGGANWDTVSVPTRSYIFYNLHFLNPNVGVVAGSGGLMLLTKDGGATWEAQNNAGASNYALTASAVNNGSVTFYTGGSNGYTFKRDVTLSQPATLAITSPVGSEVWGVGSQHAITWTSTSVTNVGIQYTTDNGTNWTSVVASTPAASGSYAWTVPNTPSVNCKVKVFDASNTSLASVSAAVFTIQSCPSYSYTAGWSMVSVPVAASNMAAASLFPGASSQVFAFNNGYSAQTTLENGKGYFVRYDNPANLSFCGSPIQLSTPINVNAGWNMIGPYGNDVPVTGITTVPAGIVNSNYFGFTYASGYSSESTLKSGKGYWVRVSQAGSIKLAIPTEKSAVQNLATNTSNISITLTDNSGQSSVLYSALNNSDLNRNDLPPVPPNGIFDARFASQRNAEMLQGASQTIQLSNASYPVTIASKNATFTVKDAATNGRLVNMVVSDSRTGSITNSAVQALVVSMVSKTPKSFELNQNYPNPFNPTTTINFAVPVKSQVTLSIYNQLGQKVATLVNGEMEAGFRSVTWNASNMASGVYFYELRAGNFTSVKKLVLMK